MIWAAVGLTQKTPLIFMRRDSDAERNGYTGRSYLWTLDEGLIPVYGPGQVFQQDNARIHLAGPVTDWFEEHGIWVIDWPPHSPDLNPIEHVWKALKEKLYNLYPTLGQLRNNERDIAILQARIREAWEQVDQVHIQRLVRSIPDRLRTCRRVQGWYTKY